MQDVPVIDADGHVMESDRELLEYLEPPFRGHPELLTFPFFPTLDGWHRQVRRVADGKNRTVEVPTAQDWLDFMDEAGIEKAVLYPTAGLGSGLIKDPDWAVAMANAYNSWIHDRFLKVSPRLLAVALVPVQDASGATQELERAITQLGMVGGVIAPVGLVRPLGHPSYFPIYQKAQDLDCPLAIHSAPAQQLGFDYFERLIEARTLSHPFGQMIQMTSMMFGGVFDAFPRLRVSYMEAGAGWVPYFMERLDMEYEHRTLQAPELKRPPSEHIKSGRIFFHTELEEAGLSYALKMLRDDIFFIASDYPHEPKEEFPEVLSAFMERQDVSEEAKGKILYENPKRLYKLG